MEQLPQHLIAEAWQDSLAHRLVLGIRQFAPGQKVWAACAAGDLHVQEQGVA